MRARRIHLGSAYWVTYLGEQIKVLVRSEANTTSQQWVCEGANRQYMSLPVGAFIRAETVQSPRLR